MNGGQHIDVEELALYAMQGATPAEAAAVRAHVDQCPECAAQLAAISGDLAAVAMSVEQKPVPEGARARFLDRIATSPEQKPRVEVVSIASRPPVRHLWVPWTIAAAAALVAAFLFVRINAMNQEIAKDNYVMAQFADQSARAQKVLDVLTAPDAHHVVLTAAKTPPAPTARAVYLASKGGLILEASNMGPLPADKTYELWVIPMNGGAPVPAGLFRPDPKGDASLILPDIPSGIHAKAFGVTIERAAGASAPTLPIILAGAVPTA